MGLLPGVTQGMTLHAAGEWRDHPKFGWQFSVHSYQTDVPSDAYSMAIYLEHVVGGIGRTLAERIVEHFGASTAQVMGDPQALREVYGIGRRKAKDIADSWLAHQHER